MNVILACNFSDRDNPLKLTKDLMVAKISPEIILHMDLPDSLIKAIKEAVQKYNFAYGLNINNVSIYEDTTSQPEQLIDGTINLEALHVKDGSIFINLQAGFTVKKLRNSVKHELFHLLNPDQISLLENHFSLFNGDLVVGYKGLKLRVLIPGNPDTINFLVLEEAAAEFCAAIIEPGYVSPCASYFALANFLSRMTESGWFKPSDLIKMQHHNDVTGFCSAILNKPREEIGIEDINFIATQFTRVFRGISLEEVFDQVKQKRRIIYKSSLLTM